MAARDQLERFKKAITIGMRPEEQQDLESISQRVKKLDDYQTLAQRPAIRELLSFFTADIAAINARLSTDRELQRDVHTQERLAMLDRKDVLLYLVALFDPSAELETLEKELDARATDFEKYNAGG